MDKGAKSLILLVDDDETVRAVLAEELASEGFSIIQAPNGEEAVALAIQGRPDLMDGWDLCCALRAMPSTKTTPFIFLTSLDKTPDRVLGIRLGADDYLTKPFSPREVVFKIRGILRRMSQRRRLLEKKEAETRDAEAGFLLADTVEFLRSTQHTGLVAVVGPSERGVIYIDKGRPVHASTGSLSGEAAVFEIFRLKSPQVRYHEGERTDLAPNLALSWEAILSRIFSRSSASTEE
jgi:CheY-like chemotaxis protein